MPLNKVACGAVLAQLHDGIEKPIAFASKAFTKGESHKSTVEQELTAIHWAVLHFRPYLYGRKFLIKNVPPSVSLSFYPEKSIIQTHQNEM